MGVWAETLNATARTTGTKAKERIGGSTELRLQLFLVYHGLAASQASGGPAFEVRILMAEGRFFGCLAEWKMFSTFSRYGNRDLRVGWTTDIDK